MMKRMYAIRLLVPMLLLLWAIPLYAAPAPEGFVGVPWGASRTQVVQMMSERGWMRLSGDPTVEAFTGAFDGMPSQLKFAFKDETFYRGSADFLARNPEHLLKLTAAKYKETIGKLTEKYGSPTESTSFGTYGEETSWTIIDSVTSDKYNISAFLLKQGSASTHSVEKRVHFYVTYEAESLRNRLGKKGL